MEKTYWLYVKGPKGDANLRVSLQNYVIPAALHVTEFNPSLIMKENIFLCVKSHKYVFIK